MAAPMKSFRFLDLPKELRLMVYEHLPVTTKHITFYNPFYDSVAEGGPAEFKSKVILVKKSVPVAILATCRSVNNEARPILAPLLHKLRQEPTRFIVDMSSLELFLGVENHDAGILRQAQPFARGELTRKSPYAMLDNGRMELDEEVYDSYYQFISLARLLRGEYAITVNPHPDPGKGEHISSVNPPWRWSVFVAFALYDCRLSGQEKVRIMINPFSSRAKELQQELVGEIKYLEYLHPTLPAHAGTVEEPTTQQWSEEWEEGDRY